MPINWSTQGDAELLKSYRPVPQLVEGRVTKHPELQKAIADGRMVTILVSNNQFTTTVQGRGQVGHAVPLKEIPDLEIQVMQSDEGEAEASLTDSSRKRLTDIKEGRSTVAQNIGVDKQQKRPHTLFGKHQAKPAPDRSLNGRSGRQMER